MGIIVQKIWGILWPSGLVVIGIYIILIILFTIFQSHFIYFPHREIVATPEEAGLSYEDVSFRTSDKLKLSGWYIPCGTKKRTVLFCHGNAGNISHRMDSI